MRPRRRTCCAPRTGRCTRPRPADETAWRRRSRSRTEITTEDTIATLTSRQRAHLRSLAHHLKPVHHVGKEGITPSAVRALEEAFNTRELLKVKVLQEAPGDPRELGDELAGRVEGTIAVQTIGRTVVLYRPHPEKPEIRLPD